MWAALKGDFADPAKRGTAMGGFNLFGSLGFATGPFILHPLSFYASQQI